MVSTRGSISNQKSEGDECYVFDDGVFDKGTAYGGLVLVVG
jgi:hypothetical protein